MKIRSFQALYDNIEFLKKNGRYDIAKKMLVAAERLLPKEEKKKK